MATVTHSDVLVIGGGMFGCFLATQAARQGHKVTLIEARDALLQAASLVNQARIHNGYHYPRSILTGIRSRENFERFAAEFPDAVVRDFTHLYAIARQGSHITAQQFALFCERIGAWCVPAEREQQQVFDSDRVEAVFQVKEYSFDSEQLRRAMVRELAATGVDVRMECRALRCATTADGHTRISLSTGEEHHARLVLNCTYGELNTLLHASNLALLPVKQEVVEIALLHMPDSLRTIGWTIMDGPFCSSIPFPARQARSLYHVRYSVHGSWEEGPGLPVPPMRGTLAERPPTTHVQHMMHDGMRYVRDLAKAEHLGSLWTVRTKLPGSAQTDSRPILFRPAQEIKHLYHVMGGKIDNVYDLEPFLNRALTDAFG